MPNWCYNRVKVYGDEDTVEQIKAEIKDYVRDHYKYYGWYPYDVQVGDVLYSYEQYMDILSMTV